MALLLLPSESGKRYGSRGYKRGQRLPASVQSPYKPHATCCGACDPSTETPAGHQTGKPPCSAAQQGGMPTLAPAPDLRCSCECRPLLHTRCKPVNLSTEKKAHTAQHQPPRLDPADRPLHGAPAIATNPRRSHASSTTITTHHVSGYPGASRPHHLDTPVPPPANGPEGLVLN